MIISPCISICKTDPLTGFCYGCGRSIDDKKMWKNEETNDEWKIENLIKIENGISLFKKENQKWKNLRYFIQKNFTNYQSF